MVKESSEESKRLLVALILRLDKRSKVLEKKLSALSSMSQATTKMIVLI